MIFAQRQLKDLGVTYGRCILSRIFFEINSPDFKNVHGRSRGEKLVFNKSENLRHLSALSDPLVNNRDQSNKLQIFLNSMSRNQTVIFFQSVMRQVLRIYAIDIYLYGVIAAGHVHT